MHFHRAGIFYDPGSLSDNNVHMLKEGFDDTLEDTNLNVVYEANVTDGLQSLQWDI